MKRTAIVTGSSRGIGEAIARRLASEGYAVCINDIQANASGIDSLSAELNDKHGAGTATGFAADVTSSAAVQSLISHSVSTLGPLTVMVANAGIAQVKPILEVTEDDVRRMFDINFMGVWNWAVPEGSTGYKIIGAASIVAFKPFQLLGHYSASKWAVRGLTQVFAMEMAPHKIAVNAYAPGIVGTKMWDEIDEKMGELHGRAKGESVKKYSLELTAMGRISVPDDVAKVVGGFLAGPDSEFVTGQTLVVDGGIVFT